MTTLEQSFGLPSLSEIENIKKALSEQNEKIEKQSEELEQCGGEMDETFQTAVDMIDSREERILSVVDMTQYDQDVDAVFKEAMGAFRDIMMLGNEAPAPSAGKMFEAAANFAKIALDSKNSKMKVRLDAIDLALKKQKLDNSVKDTQQPLKDAGSGVVMDRNELLKSIRSELKKD